VAKRRGTGKPCGASHIAADKTCRVSMPSAIGRALNAAAGDIGANTLYQAAKAVGRGNLKRYHEIRLQLNKEVGGNIVKGARADEFKRRLQEAGVIPNGKPKTAAPAPESIPKKPDTLPAKPNSLENWGTAQLVAKKRAAWLLWDDKKVARFDAELNRRGWKAPEPSAPTQASFDTKSSRKSAKRFDEEMKTEQLRRDGDQTFDRWDETTGSGSKKIGQGAFGTVVKDKDSTYAVKRGDISDTEAKLIQKIGDRDLGPKLIAADVDGPGWERAPGVDNRRGRIAMTIVDGEPIGIYRRPDDMIGGVRVADAYWTARAQLHRMGIAHNDMHIDNVLVDNNGKGRFVDMGLAQDSPKAALAEAMGAFNPPKGGQADRTSAGGAGQGDWQVRRYSGTGGELLATAQRNGNHAVLERRAPVAARVLDNKNALQFRMLKDGFSKDDIATVMDHGLRSDPSSYNRGIWQRITDQQALDYINLLYDGV
jgi:hypothetical protein